MKNIISVNGIEYKLDNLEITMLQIAVERLYSQLLFTADEEVLSSVEFLSRNKNLSKSSIALVNLYSLLCETLD